MATQEQRFGQVVHTDATATRAPQRDGQMRHFVTQSLRVDRERQPYASADERVLVDERLIRQIVHRDYSAVLTARAKELR
jgi:hypothetical protein